MHMQLTEMMIFAIGITISVKQYEHNILLQYQSKVLRAGGLDPLFHKVASLLRHYQALMTLLGVFIATLASSC